MEANTMTNFFTTACALALTITSANAAGYTTQTIPVDHRDRDVELHIWYPNQLDTDSMELGKNAVFKGSTVYPDATIQPGDHPLIVMSHGSGGNAANLSWIASELADRGMIVVAPNHPGTMSNDSFPEQTVKLWERPMDLSAAIDHATQNFDIDEDNIGAIGFSLGGYSTMGLAGARVVKQDYIDYCDKAGDMMDCGWFARGNLDLNSIDQTMYERSNRDPRISVATAIDPALAQAYNAESLKELNIPVQLINLGAEGQIAPPVDAATFVSNLSKVDLHFVDQANHFSFLGECTAMGKVLIMAAGEDPICSETGNRSRADIHTELKAMIGDFMQEHLIGERQANLDD
jgi:predicted dienelactone hydrolase